MWKWIVPSITTTGIRSLSTGEWQASSGYALRDLAYLLLPEGVAHIPVANISCHKIHLQDESEYPKKVNTPPKHKKS